MGSLAGASGAAGARGSTMGGASLSFLERLAGSEATGSGNPDSATQGWGADSSPAWSAC